MSSPGIKYFDAYSKPKDDYAERTVAGGILSISSIVAIVILSIHAYWETTTIRIVSAVNFSELVVDKSRNERMNINVNITFPAIPCHLLNMDVMDVAGEQQNDLNQKLTKLRIDRFGKRIAEEYRKKEVAKVCGNCYGARPPPSGCCNTCEDVRNAYLREGWALSKVKDVQQCVEEGWADELDFDKGEGCVLIGSTTVNRVSGNFHFVPGKSYKQNNYHVHDVQFFQDRLDEFHFGHKVNRLSFGQDFEGMSSPLDNYQRDSENGVNFFQYYIKVVPTKVIYLNGTEFLTNQYAVTQYESKSEEKRIPGIFFNYDISPMLVIYAEKKKPFSTFFTELCGIIGGIYTLTALIDSIFYRAERHMKSKIATGKLQ